MADRIAELFEQKTARRAVALITFLGLIILFRQLAVLLVFFVLFERALFFTAGLLSRRLKWPRLAGLMVVLLLAAGTLTLIGFTSAGRLKAIIIDTRDTLPQRMAAVREHPWYTALEEYLPDSEDLAKSAEHYAQDVAKSAAAVGRVFVSAVIGFILAAVYFLDQDRIRAFRDSLRPRTLFGTLVRWFEHLAESVSLTVQLQLVVAGCNAVLTLPVLLLIGVPHIPALMALIFVSGMIPVVGNMISGWVLIVISFQVKGWVGVVIFVVLTFVLHKIESYYLNPRLTARHVALPSFMLILSIIAWEHLLGFAGLFMSFPVLYLAGKLRAEFQEEDAPPILLEEAPTTPTAPSP
jgi:predicted PurR-regulated permease PerM